MRNKSVSIIIPCKEINSLTEKCVTECLRLNYDDFEILVLPDKINKKLSDKKLKVIETGKVKPAFKRNLGMQKAKGDLFAFIDSDAYPEKNWLKNAVKYFDDEKVGLVGGPNLTPEKVNIWERISGYALSNFFVSGFADIRYKIAKAQIVKELPSCNYISRREISPKYDPDFLTAEDSEFCFSIAKQGYEVLYAGDVIVYHHRRDSLAKHVKQTFIYGRDIAWLSKKDFSFDKLYYSVLSLFLIGFIIGAILSFFYPVWKTIFSLLVFIYLFIILFSSIHENLKITILTTITGILTHFSYGVGWLYGVFVGKK